MQTTAARGKCTHERGMWASPPSGASSPSGVSFCAQQRMQRPCRKPGCGGHTAGGGGGAATAGGAAGAGPPGAAAAGGGAAGAGDAVRWRLLLRGATPSCSASSSSSA